MIELERLTKRFGEKTVVDDLTFTVAEGTLFAFVGPNGAGKTTTIKMLVGLLRPSDGRCRIFGHDVIADGRDARAMVSYIPDQPHLYDKLTGGEFLDMVGRMFGMDEDRLQRRFREVVELFEIEPFLDDLVEEYSHGMKQRCAMAAAFIHDPRVIVVDEPMVGLDPKHIRRMKRVFRAFVDQGNIVFMSTHTLSNVDEMADHVGIIHRGRLLAEGTVEEVRHKAGDATRFEDSFFRLTEESP